MFIFHSSLLSDEQWFVSYQQRNFKGRGRDNHHKIERMNRTNIIKKKLLSLKTRLIASMKISQICTWNLAIFWCLIWIWYYCYQLPKFDGFSIDCSVLFQEKSKQAIILNVRDVTREIVVERWELCVVWVRNYDSKSIK